MGLFGSKTPREEPLFKTSYMGFWINIYPNRVEFKSGVGSKSIPINEIASIQLSMFGVGKITLETAGGTKYSIPTHKKKAVQQAIYDAQAQLGKGNQPKTSDADEITKLNELKEKGVLTQKEFDQKKKQILGI